MRILLTLAVVFIVVVFSYFGSYSQGVSIKGYDYSGKNLSNCDFSNAKIWNSNFDNANLDYCDFSNANIYDSSFKMSSMKFSRFTGAKIVKSNFNYGNLAYSNFSNTVFLKNNINSVNFSYSLFDATDFTLSTGIKNLSDGSIFVGKINGESGLEWIPTESTLDYRHININTTDNLKALAKKQFESDQYKAIKFMKELENKKSEIGVKL